MRFYKLFFKLACLGFFFISGTLAKADNLLAFPGAEGFGKYAVGGRGGKVVAVTNLEDYKSTETPIIGSLRWALSQYVQTDSVYRKYTAVGGGDSLVKKAITVYTPLTVVFKVSGTIWLKEDFKVKRDSLTIAGQTAPGDGICIAGHSLLFNGATGGELFYWGPRRKDVIVRYIRFRPGIPRDANGVPTSSYVTYGTDVENYENFIMDHCSISWANEECLATYDTKNVSIQWCMVAEGLECAYHGKGLRGYCGVWGGQYVSYHHNLIAHNVSRTVRFNGSTSHDTTAIIDYRNNVIYNWVDGAYGGAVQMAGGMCQLNIVNNYYKKGPATSTSTTISSSNKAHRILNAYDTNTSVPAKYYVTGNYIYGFPEVTASNWKYGVQFDTYSVADTAATYSIFRQTAFSPEVAAVLPATLDPATTSFNQVVDNAGACLPIRDAQDKRIPLETKNGTASGMGTLASFIVSGKTYTNPYFNLTKGIIDDPMAVGGWPVLTTGIVPTDSDNDGMPDDFETTNSLNPNDSIDGNSFAPSGYTWLEEYLNSITSNTTLMQAPFNLKATIKGANSTQLNWVDNTELETNYEVERAIRGGSFENIATMPANSTSYTDATLIDQNYVYRVRAINSNVQSAYSNEANCLQAPELKTISLSSNKPVMTWFDNSSIETGYKVYREITGTNDLDLLTTLAANVTTYTDATTQEAVNYTYKVASVYNTLETMSTNAASITPVFLAPTSLSIVLNGDNKPQLSWTDNSSVEEGYEIQRAVSGVNVYLPIDTVSSSSFNDPAAIGGVTYIYKIRAMKGTDFSAFSNTATIAVPAGIQKNQVTHLKLYPNPVKDELKITADKLIREAKIYNNIGLLVGWIQQDVISAIDMSQYPQGVYYIELTTIDDLGGIYKIIKL